MPADMNSITIFRRWAIVILLAAAAVVGLVACQQEEPVVEAEEVVKAAAIVQPTVEATAEPAATPTPTTTPTKDLVVCMSQEPDTLYPYGSSMLASRAVQHAIFENSITSLSFAHQAQGIQKIPSLADGDAAIRVVLVNEGERVLTALNEPKALAVGDTIINAAGEAILFDGTPVEMEQMVVNFTMRPTVFADGTPVRASDSVYSFQIAADPATLTDKTVIRRTLAYEATGDLTTRWTGLPGYKDSTYYLNFWTPYPEHLWGKYAAADLVDAEEVGRLPIGDGPFRIMEWIPGESIQLVKNEYYYRAAEGYPLLDSVTFRFIPDTNQLLTRLLSGQCDIGTQDALSTNEAPFLIEADSSGILVPYFQIGTVYEHMDFNIAPYGDYADSRYGWFEDVRVRQAMTMCTDRQGMIDDIMYGRSEIIHTYVPAIHPLYPVQGLTQWPHDPDAANALLDEAGYQQRDADGFRLDPGGARFAPTAATTAGNALRRQIMNAFKEDMVDCGIDVQIEFLPSDEWFADHPDGPLFGRQYDLAEFAWLTGVEPACNLYRSDQIPGPLDEINPLTGRNYNGWGGQNNTGYVSAEFDAACIKAMQSLPGTPEHVEGHTEAQIIFSRDVPVIPLFLRLKVAAALPRVLNFSIDATQASEMYNLYEIDLRR